MSEPFMIGSARADMTRLFEFGFLTETSNAPDSPKSRIEVVMPPAASMLRATQLAAPRGVLTLEVWNRFPSRRSSSWVALQPAISRIAAAIRSLMVPPKQPASSAWLLVLYVGRVGFEPTTK